MIWKFIPEDFLPYGWFTKYKKDIPLILYSCSSKTENGYLILSEENVERIKEDFCLFETKREFIENELIIYLHLAKKTYIRL